MPDQPRLSAVICTYDRYDVLPQAIESLLNQEVAAESFELIIVDNSPANEQAAALAARYANIPRMTYRIEARPGLSNARNVGAQAARGQIVAFIDDDAIASPGWARAIIEAYDSWGGHAGIVGGRVALRWPSGKPGWMSKPLLGYLGHCDLGDKPRELAEGEWLVGCNLSYDREALIAAGGFDTKLGRQGSGSNSLLSNEELEANQRIKAQGKREIYAPSAYVEHIVDPARVSQSWFRRRAAWQAVSDFISRPSELDKIFARSARRLRRLSIPRRKPECIGFFSEKKTSIGFKQDMDLIYDLVILALAGGATQQTAVASASGLLARLFGGTEREPSQTGQAMGRISH